MSTSTSRKPEGNRPLLPPPEQFWMKYSARHEFPLSSAVAIFLHALAIGLILLVGYLAQLRWYGPENKPVESDVVMLEGEGGAEGGSGPEGAPGDGGKPSEISLPAGSDPYRDLVSTLPTEVAPPTVELDPDALRTDAKEEFSTTDFLEKLKDAGREPVVKATIPEKGSSKVPAISGKKFAASGGVKGVGGLGGTGFGTGRGKGVGPGTGTGGLGRPLTRQEFLARRWKFDLGGSPKTHMDKLAKVGFIVGIEELDGRFYTIVDLKSVPVERRADNFAKYKDAVQWENTRPESVIGVAKEMGLAKPVKRILLFLPKDREEKIAQEEQRYAKEMSRPLDSFRHVWFDFEVRGGVYEPRAKAIE